MTMSSSMTLESAHENKQGIDGMFLNNIYI